MTLSEESTRRADPSLDEDRFEEWLARRRLDRRQQLARLLPTRDACLWLALVPGWTEPLLVAALKVPPDQAAGVVAWLSQAKLIRIERQWGAADDDAPVIEVTEEGRAVILAELADRPGELRQALARAAATLRSVSDSTPGMTPSLRRWAELGVALVEPAAVASVLDQRVEAALALRNASAPDIPEAVSWLSQARSFALLLEREHELGLSVAIQRGTGRVELARRQAAGDADFRVLRHYLSRPVLDELFRTLLAGPDQLWALHFIGAGGVGKSMLIRHLAADTVVDEPIATARVDFDYLHADYPGLAPGLLLDSFGAQLLPYATNTQTLSLFDAASRTLQELHQRLQADRTSPRRGSPTADPRFREALSLYLDALKTLDRRVVLILDTCEELAKVNPDRRSQPASVVETFRVLRALHDGLPALDLPEDALIPATGGPGLSRLRVIFCGRRLLASAGQFAPERNAYRWQVPDPVQSGLPARPYLRLHELRGFDEQEARAYLEQRNARDLAEYEQTRSADPERAAPRLIPTHLFGAIIDRSRPDAGSVVDPAIWRDQPVDNPDPAARCNPYELNFFASWASDEPGLTDEQIRSATDDRYVQTRIIDRLGNAALVRVLPTVAELGHVDERTCEALLQRADEEARDTFAHLRDQEWVRARYGPRGEVVLDVDRGTRRRILAFYARPGRATERDEQRDAAARELAARTATDPLDTLDWSVFDAALRVMQWFPERAVAWWEEVGQRMLRERGPQWTYDTTRSLLGEDGAAVAVDDAPPDAPELENGLRPLVLMTHAAALWHTGRFRDLREIWTQAETALQRARLPASVRDRVARRLPAGQLLALLAEDAEPGSLRTRQAALEDACARFWDQLDQLPTADVSPLLAASWIGTVELLLVLAEVERVDQVLAMHLLSGSAPLTPSPPPSNPLLAPATTQGDWTALDRLPSDRPPGPVRLARLILHAFAASDTGPVGRQVLVVFACSLAGRALVRERRYADALAWLQAAMSFPSDRTELAGSPWDSWRVPDDVAARVRLEAVRLLYPAWLSASQARSLLDGLALTRVTNADQERLASAGLGLELADRLPPADRRVVPAPELDDAPAPWTAPPTVRRAAPELFVQVARLRAANGLVSRAVQPLRAITRTARGSDVETIRQAQRTWLTIARRMRLREVPELADIDALSFEPAALGDQELVWAGAALDGLPPPPLTSLAPHSPDADQESHARWRVTPAGADEQVPNLPAQAGTTVARRAEGPPTPSLDFLTLSLLLDALEAELVRGGPVNRGARRQQWSETLDRYQVTNPDHPEEALRVWLRARALLDGLPLDLAPIGDRLGHRRSAEIALDEGEMLLLRLPGQAVQLVEQACSWYRAANDPIGAFVAQTLAVMLRESPRTETPSSAESVDLLMHCYAGLLARLNGDTAVLPAAEQVVDAVRERALDPLLAQAEPAWRPWLRRMAVCLVAHDGGDPTPLLPVASPSKPLARDLQLLAAARPEAVPATPPEPEAESEQSLTTRVRTTLGNILAVLLGLAAIGGLLFVTLSGLPSLWQRVGSLGTGTELAVLGALAISLVAGLMSVGVATKSANPPPIVQTAIAAVVLVVVVPALLDRAVIQLGGPADTSNYWRTSTVLAACLLWFGVVLQWRSNRAALVRVVLSISADPGAPATDAVSLEFVVRGVFGGPLHLVRLLLGGASPTAGYVDLARTLPDVLRKELRARQRPLRGHALQVSLRVAPDSGDVALHEPCWEALIAQPSRADDDLHDLRCTIRRSVDPPAASPSGATVRAPSETVRLLMVGHGLEVRSPWAGLGAAGITAELWKLSALGRLLEAEPPQPGVRIVHLRGSVEDTNAGLRFRAGETVVQSVYGQEAAASAIETAVDLRAADLARVFPDLSLCILQGEWAAGTRERLDSARRRAGRTRRFAAELAERGVPATIIVPPMPPAAAGDALAILADFLHRRPEEGAAALALAAHAIRRRVLARGDRRADDQPGPDVLLETALDVCVYVQPNWSPKVELQPAPAPAE